MTHPMPRPTRFGGQSTIQGPPRIETLESRTFLAASPVTNPIVAENLLPGTAPSVWQIAGSGDPSLQGFSSDISVNRGGIVSFKIDDTSSAPYHIDIYRMGYYGGLGARRVATIASSQTLHQAQPRGLRDATTGLLDCGNWAISASWDVPDSATSGIYFAELVRDDTGGRSQIFFIVRDDASHSDLLFKTSDTTWQAYNTFGGSSFYKKGSLTSRAYASKVSYNRPFADGEKEAKNFVFNAEYPMVRWLEANGYDVSYFTSVDAERYGAEILQHKVMLSVGHDEYWSAGERANVQAARDAGVNLAFFSGNEVFWKTRWAESLDESDSSYRTLVCYKETHANAKIDPAPGIWTGTWRDPRFSPPADGGRPENALTGTLFGAISRAPTDALTVPAADGKLRLWRDTSVARLESGESAVFSSGTLGFEWDRDIDNGFRPAGEFDLSTTVVDNVRVLHDFGSTYRVRAAVHHLTLYRAASGALVFGAGTVQWSWGLDANHTTSGPPADPRMQQATVNLLADMHAQPASLQGGLILASASTDTIAPSSTITSPVAGGVLPRNSKVTIAGTASDIGGVVGGVEVSVDGGATWHPASGREHWTFSWKFRRSGPIQILSRAVDDSGNLEMPRAGIGVVVN